MWVYDQSAGRFLTRDPIESVTRSAYDYVGNDPLNATDPTGLFCLLHNDDGGCVGAGVLEAAQRPIQVVGVDAGGVAAGAQTLAAGCAASIIGLPCTFALEPIAITASSISTLASLETTLYECFVDGLTRSCLAGGASTIISGLAGPVGRPLTPLLRAILYDASLTASAATARVPADDCSPSGGGW